MRFHSPLTPLILPASVIVAGFYADHASLKAQPGPINCDNECRHRVDHYTYNAATPPSTQCYKFTYLTCINCAAGNYLCVDRNDSLGGSCTPEGQNGVTYYNICGILCPSTTAAIVEAGPTMSGYAYYTTGAYKHKCV
jgi:hypothetical protein